jgi:PAS domain S-box-containing protein
MANQGPSNPASKLKTPSKDEAELTRIQRIGRIAGIDIDLANGMTTPGRSREYKDLHGLADKVTSETHEDWLRRLHPDDRDRADKALRAAIDGGAATYESEYRIIRPNDGRVRWILAKAEIERDTDGRALRLVGAHIDITERKLAEEALSVELSAMKRLHDVAQRALAGTDRQRLYADLLDSAMSLHGASCGMLQIFDAATGKLSIGAHQGLKQAFLDRFHEIDADSVSVCGMALRDRARVVVDDVEEADALKPVLKIVRTARIRAGQSTPLFSASGELIGMVSTYFRQVRTFSDTELRLTDVFARLASDAIVQMHMTEALKASEHHLERVLESVSDGLIVINSEGAITYINAAARQMLAAQGVNANEMMGRDYRGSISAIAGPEGVKRFQQVMDGREAVEFEFHYAGWDVWYAVRAFPVREGGISIYYHDITDRKRAESALRASKESLTRLVESISDVFLVISEDWTLQSANAAGRVFLESIGVKAENVLGREFWQSFPELAGTEIERHYRRAMRQRIPVRFEFFYEQAQQWYSLRVYPIAGDGISVYLQDVTTRKQAEAALAANEQSLHRLVESIADSFVVIGSDWTYKYANETARNIFRRTDKRPEDLMGKEVWEAYPHLMGSDMEQAMRETMYDRRATRIEHSHDGQWYLSHFYPIEGDGISVFTQDITERKRMEEELRHSEMRWKLLTDAMPQIVWIGRADTGDSVYVNEQFSHYTGAPNEAFMGQGWQHFVHPEDREMAATEWTLARERSEAFDVEFRMRRFDGAFRWFKVRGVPMPGTDGEVKVWYGTCTDIQDTMEARFRAESADRAKSEFLANMSHEIRTPLNAIIGLTSIMLQFETEPEAYRKYLTTIKDSASSLAQLINDVLEFARIDANMVELHEAEFQPAELLEEVFGITSVKAREKGLRTHLHCDLAPEATFIGDALRIKQVLINLMANAVKFTDSGDVDLVLTTRPQSGGVTILSATVRDTGIGIDADKIEHIFAKFTQADASITRRYGGTGLGLAISRRLAETMGGSLRVRSERGHGSSFTLEVPLRKVDAARVAAKPKPIDRGRKSRRVLIVEDNPTNAMVAGTMLKKLGYDYDVASDGRQGVLAWQAGRFDVILMDLQMPDMDGVQAARRIRQMERLSGDKPVTIIATTAHAMGEDRERCMAAGMDDFIAKPFTVEMLIEKLEGVSA